MSKLLESDENKKPVRYTMRMSFEEKQTLDQLAQKTGISKRDLMILGLRKLARDDEICRMVKENW